MYSYGSPLLKSFKESELNLTAKKSNPDVHRGRKGRFYAFLFFSGLVILLAIPLYKGFVNWQDTRSLEDQNPVVELISNRGGGNTASSSASLEPIQPEKTFLFEKIVAADKVPTRIIVPSIAIDLEVAPAKVVNGYWEIFEKLASFGLGSAPPGEVGNTVIFAHAREGLFLPIRKIKKDATIYVFTKNNWYSYKVEDIKFVKPNQAEVIAPTEDETLTLYTCSGFADTKRLIVRAKRI